jgi:hypothetical protein
VRRAARIVALRLDDLANETRYLDIVAVVLQADYEANSDDWGAFTGELATLAKAGAERIIEKREKREGREGHQGREERGKQAKQKRAA